MLDLVVRGRFALPGGRIEDGEIGIAQGRIAALAAPGELTGAERIDVARRAPDPARPRRRARAHGQRARRGRRARDRVGRRRRRDDDHRHALRRPRARRTPSRASSRRSRTSRPRPLVDVALYATVAPSGGLDEIAPLHAAGAAAFKVSTFETHPVRFPRVPDGELLLAMAICARLGALVCFHPENDDIVRRLSEQLAAEGRSDPMAHADARPPGGRERGDRPGAGARPRHRLPHAPLPRLDRARLRARRAARSPTASTPAPRPARTTS